MPSFSYNQNIPDAPNNPSRDQPLMKTNTNSINGIIGIDHFTFQNPDNLDGYHQKSTYPRFTGSLPLLADSGVTYTKQGFNISNDETQLLYSPDASGDEYQLTRCNSGNYATFSTMTQYTNVPDPNITGGWTFLPGGSNTGALLFQYGKFYVTSANGFVPFPITFNSSVFSITIGEYSTSSTGTDLLVIDSGTPPSLSGFNFRAGSNRTIAFFWHAIGF